MRSRTWLVPLIILAFALAPFSLPGCRDGNVSGESMNSGSGSSTLGAGAENEQATAEAVPPSPPPKSNDTGKNSGQATVLVEVPGLLGATYEEAVAILAGMGFRVTSAEDYSEHHAAGLICDQDPSGCGSVADGSAVTLVVSLGPPLMDCPSCGGDGYVMHTYTCPECGGTGARYT